MHTVGSLGVKSVCLCRLLADIECAKSYAKIAESAKTLASQQVSNQCRQFHVHNMYANFIIGD